MKSVLKTFSYSAQSMLTKVCLAALCVVVFSNLGNSQSFRSVTDSHEAIRTVLSTLDGVGEPVLSAQVGVVPQIKQTDEDGNAVMVASPNQEENVRKAYYNYLRNAIGYKQHSTAVSVAIDETYQKMYKRYSAEFKDYLIELNEEVTNLLTN